MKTVLIISSAVASGFVGAKANAFGLNAAGHDTIVLPTVLFGRHPGHGDPGGQRLTTDTIEAMWNAVQHSAASIDAVLTGYMPSPEHIALTVRIIKAVRAANPHSFICVDPIMGDHGRLYVPEGVAQSVRQDLVPIADLITPNLWELSFLSGQSVAGPSSIVQAARALAPRALITSVPFGSDGTGALYTTDTAILSVSHALLETVPNGTGDSLTGLFLADYLNGSSAETALGRSVGRLFRTLQSVQTGAPDLSLSDLYTHLETAPLLPVTDATASQDLT